MVVFHFALTAKEKLGFNVKSCTCMLHAAGLKCGFSYLFFSYYYSVGRNFNSYSFPHRHLVFFGNMLTKHPEQQRSVN